MKIIKKIIGVFIFGTLGGLLGSLGGTDGVSKGVRRFGIPVIITILALLTLHNAFCVTIMFMSFVLSIGYGMPCFIPGWTDEGSALGRFFYKLTFKIYKDTPTNSDLPNILTRGTIGLLIALSMLSIPILTGNWLYYSIFTVIIVITFATISWRSLSTFRVFKKDLLYSEFVPYAILVGLSQLLICIKV